MAELPGKVVVRKRPDELYPDRPWLARIVDSTTGPSDASGDRSVGRYPTMADAVRTGISAARFIAAGVPWRAEL